MKRFVLVCALACLIGLCLTFSSSAKRKINHTTLPQDDNGCDLTFTGSARKRVKLRSTTLDYPLHNSGRAISVRDFLSFVCPLDADVPHPVPASQPMEVEKVTVTLKGFVMAMKKDPDNDLHIQIADAARPYRQRQIIVEIPPTEAYCTARTKMMDLFRADGGGRLSAGHIFADPPPVEVTGYLFLDSTHGPSCTANGGRGIKDPRPHGVSPVKGTWEIHPVISLKDAH
jgi:hypothetical protein